MSKKAIDTQKFIKVKKGSTGKALITATVIVIAASVAVKAVSKHVSKLVSNKNDDDNSSKDRDFAEYSALFNGIYIKAEKKPFKGAVIKNICGGMKLDLSDVSITEDVDIHCKNIMSGISIIVPENVKVDISGKTILSGVANKVSDETDETLPTIYIYADNVMSGMEVRTKGTFDDAKNGNCCEDENEEEIEKEIEKEIEEEIEKEIEEEIEEEIEKEIEEEIDNEIDEEIEKELE